MRNIYFLKMDMRAEINYVYSDEKDFLNNELKLIYNLITNDSILEEGMEYKYFRKLDNNEEKEESINFYLHLLRKDESKKIIMGDFRKTTPIHYNIEDENKELKSITRDSIEGIRFIFDIKNEYICFYTSNRFGFNQFKEYFSMYINYLLNRHKNTEDVEYIEFQFVKSNLGLEEFYKELKNFGKIKKISLELRLPNPNEKHKKKLLESLKDKSIDPKDVRVTQITTILESEDEKGINIESDPISNEIDIYNDINVRFKNEQKDIDATLNYFKAEAENFKGEVMKSEKNEKYTYRIKKEETFEEPFWKKGRSLLQELVNSIRS